MRRLAGALRRPFVDLQGGMEQLVDAPRPALAIALAAAALVATWFVYVPIHELLHVAGCIATGGRVSELEIQPEYGGALLARWFDFVVVGGDYSGRLTGFDTRGSDLVYLATDIAPYLLSVFPGVALLRAASRRPLPLAFGAGIVVGLAPFYNLLGDYYEMGSIVATRALTLATGAGPEPALEGLRSDDVVALTGQLLSSPEGLGLSAGDGVLAAAVVTVGLAVGLGLAFVTYAAGDVIAGRGAASGESVGDVGEPG